MPPLKPPYLVTYRNTGGAVTFFTAVGLSDEVLSQVSEPTGSLEILDGNLFGRKWARFHRDLYRLDADLQVDLALDLGDFPAPEARPAIDASDVDQDGRYWYAYGPVDTDDIYLRRLSIDGALDLTAQLEVGTGATDVRAIAISWSGAVVYYVGNTDMESPPLIRIRKYDIAADVASDFVADAGRDVAMLTVGRSGSIYAVCYGTGEFYLQKYRTDGTQVWEYTIPTLGVPQTRLRVNFAESVGYVQTRDGGTDRILIIDLATGTPTQFTAITDLEPIELDAGLILDQPLECCEAPDDSDDPILAFVPEIKDTTTHNQALETVATIPIEDDPDAAVTLAPSLGGNVWIVYDVNA